MWCKQAVSGGLTGLHKSATPKSVEVRLWRLLDGIPTRVDVQTAVAPPASESLPLLTVLSSAVVSVVYHQRVMDHDVEDILSGELWRKAVCDGGLTKKVLHLHSS